MANNSLLICLFCRSCKPKIVLPVLQIKPLAISRSQFVQKNQSTTFGVIEETMDLSNILLAVWNFKHNFIKVLTPECNVFAHDFRIAIRAKAMQTHYELLFLFFYRNIFDILLCIKCWVGLKICSNTSKFTLNWRRREKNWNFKFCERWRRKKSLTCIGTIIVKWMGWNQAYQNINSYLVFGQRS